MTDLFAMEPVILSGPGLPESRVPLADRLREETQAAHTAVEALPFSHSVMAGALPRDAYVGQLIVYRDVLAALESAMSTTSHRAVASIWRPERSRIAALDDDLDVLGPVSLPDAATDAGCDLQTLIGEAAAQDPVSLLGVFYVFEGSAMGGIFMSRFIADAYGFEDRGFRYYFGHGFETARLWKALREELNALPLGPGETRRVVDAARRTFDAIGRLLGALHTV